MNFFNTGPRVTNDINQFNGLQEAVRVLGKHAPVTEEKKLGPDAVEFIWNHDRWLVLMEATTFRDLQPAYRARTKEHEEQKKNLKAVHDSVSGH